MDEIESTFIGIDIAKYELVVYVLPANTQFTVSNSIKCFRQLIKLFKEHPLQQILCEATDGLERLLVAQLAAKGLPIVIVNPRQAHNARD